jgi:hypothetical protein
VAAPVPKEKRLKHTDGGAGTKRKTPEIQTDSGVLPK